MAPVSPGSMAQRRMRQWNGSAALLFLPLLTDCPTAFQPGSLLTGDPLGHGRQLGCLELGASFTGDVLRVALGNRCRYPIQVDLRHLAVRAACQGGLSCPVRPYDPRGEISLGTLDGRDQGWEKIRYPAVAKAAWWCIDIAGLTPAEPVPPGSAPPPEICGPWPRRQPPGLNLSSGPQSPEAAARP